MMWIIATQWWLNWISSWILVPINFSCCFFHVRPKWFLTANRSEGALQTVFLHSKDMNRSKIAALQALEKRRTYWTVELTCKSWFIAFAWFCHQIWLSRQPKPIHSYGTIIALRSNQFSQLRPNSHLIAHFKRYKCLQTNVDSSSNDGWNKMNIPKKKRRTMALWA